MKKTPALVFALLLAPVLAVADDKLPTEISETDSLKYQLAVSQAQAAKSAVDAAGAQLTVLYKLGPADHIDFNTRKIVRETKAEAKAVKAPELPKPEKKK